MSDTLPRHSSALFLEPHEALLGATLWPTTHHQQRTVVQLCTGLHYAAPLCLMQLSAVPTLGGRG
eukprot:8573843-Alexandrium_andersonii.AAC.1